MVIIIISPRSISLCVLLLPESGQEDAPSGSQTSRVQLREEAESRVSIPRTSTSFPPRHRGERPPLWRYGKNTETHKVVSSGLNWWNGVRANNKTVGEYSVCSDWHTDVQRSKSGLNLKREGEEIGSNRDDEHVSFSPCCVYPNRVSVRAGQGLLCYLLSFKTNW